ncbi:Organ specific protein, partial [Trema orientale]
MKSRCAVIVALLSLLLYSMGTTESRKDPGEYWTTVMNDQPMPEAIQELIREASSDQEHFGHYDRGVDTKSEKSFTKELETNTEQGDV